jgi:hypothetical protein
VGNASSRTPPLPGPVISTAFGIKKIAARLTPRGPDSLLLSQHIAVGNNACSKKAKIVNPALHLTFTVLTFTTVNCFIG